MSNRSSRYTKNASAAAVPVHQSAPSRPTQATPVPGGAQQHPQQPGHAVHAPPAEAFASIPEPQPTEADVAAIDPANRPLDHTMAGRVLKYGDDESADAHAPVSTELSHDPAAEDARALLERTESVLPVPGAKASGKSSNKRERDPSTGESAAKQRPVVYSQPSEFPMFLGSGPSAGDAGTAPDLKGQLTYPDGSEFAFADPDEVADVGRDFFLNLRKWKSLKSPLYETFVTGPGGSKVRLRVMEFRWRLEHECTLPGKYNKPDRTIYRGLCYGNTPVADPDKTTASSSSGAELVKGMWVPPEKKFE